MPHTASNCLLDAAFWFWVQLHWLPTASWPFSLPAALCRGGGGPRGCAHPPGVCACSRRARLVDVTWPPMSLLLPRRTAACDGGGAMRAAVGSVPSLPRWRATSAGWPFTACPLTMDGAAGAFLPA